VDEVLQDNDRKKSVKDYKEYICIIEPHIAKRQYLDTFRHYTACRYQRHIASQQAFFH
jgi:hypothetical protein